MLRAVWNELVLAEAPRRVPVEGNHYFPPDSVKTEYFAGSRTKTLCPWKGLASYYNLTSDRGNVLDVAWYYPHPSPLARRIKNHVAFYPEVTVVGEPEPRPEAGFWDWLFGRGPRRDRAWHRRVISWRSYLIMGLTPKWGMWCRWIGPSPCSRTASGTQLVSGWLGSG